MNPPGFCIFLLFIVLIFLLAILKWIDPPPKDMKMSDEHIYKWIPAHYAHDPECPRCKAALQEEK